MTRTPAVKVLVHPSQGSDSSSIRNKKELQHQRRQQQQQQQRHVSIRTPPRSLLDTDVESSSEQSMPTVLLQQEQQNLSSPRRMLSVAMSPKLSPQLSHISHASSTARQQEQRHQHQDQREPSSPYIPLRDRHPSLSYDDNNLPIDELKSLSKSQPQSRQHEYKSEVGKADTSIEDENDQEDVFVDLTDFFLLLQRRQWDTVYEFLKIHPSASKQTIHSQNGTTPLLHIVLRHGPPLSVVDLLLARESALDRSISSSSPSSPSPSSVWNQLDTHGRLPLHAACSCGPETSLDVISRLIEADPDALQIRSKDPSGRYPLHLAVITNASDDVVMELMVHYPDASFRPDSHGKLPVEYAKDSCYGHNRLVVALEWAPMFLAASQAAYKRCEQANGSKLRSLREAHASYETELEDRCQSEKMILIREQIRCSNDLTNEKERNILLAEAVVIMKESKRKLIVERAVLESKFDRELLVWRTRTQGRDEELKQILLGETKKKNDGSKSLGGKNENKNEKKDEEEDKTNQSADISFVEGPSFYKASLPTLLQRISKGYESNKRRNQLYKKNLERQRATNQSLTTFLATKEDELRKAGRKSRSDEAMLKIAVDRAEDLSKQHTEMLEQLSKTRTEVKRLQQIDSERERKLAHSKRRLRIQEKRLSGVTSLIDALKVAKGRDESRLDLIQEEETETEIEIERNTYTSRDSTQQNSEQGWNDMTFDGTMVNVRTSSVLSNAADLSADLSIEIEMAAMAAAHLDDTATTTSTSSSTSERRRQADLSAELEAATTSVSEFNPQHRYPDSTLEARTAKRSFTPEQAQKTSDAGVVMVEGQYSNRYQHWGLDKVSKWIAGSNSSTPQSFSVGTLTTASCGEDSFGDDCNVGRGRGAPSTPPVPEQVSGRSRNGYDRCSPLASPKLEFRLDS